MEDSAIARYICERFPGIVPVAAWGEISFFYNPRQALPPGVCFATLKAKDGDNDKASNLSRPSVFHLNIGIGKAKYRTLFGPPPARPLQRCRKDRSRLHCPGCAASTPGVRLDGLGQCAQPQPSHLRVGEASARRGPRIGGSQVPQAGSDSMSPDNSFKGVAHAASNRPRGARSPRLR